MLAYTGAGASAGVRVRCRALGLRTLACPRDFPGIPTWRGIARRVARWGHGWAYDNGVFEMFRRGERFEGSAEAHWINTVFDLGYALDERALAAPDWCVLPDVVAHGRSSLRLSLRTLERVQDSPLRWALVVQNGMTPETLPWDAPFDVVFVGGDLKWKLETGAAWAAAAHDHGRTCHVGRVGTADRVLWARRANVDSIDSCLPLWSDGQFDRFAAALAVDIDDQGPLFRRASM